MKEASLSEDSQKSAPLAKKWRPTVDKWNLAILKWFCTANEAVSWVKKKPTKKETLSAICLREDKYSEHQKTKINSKK